MQGDPLMFGLLLACGVLPNAGTPPPPPPTDDSPRLAAPGFDCTTVDHDGDGWNGCEDCDDTDPSTWPGAPAVCFDGRNNSCGVNDETPCTLEGKFRVTEVGARVMAPKTGAVDIQPLWGEGAVVVGGFGYFDPLHTGRIAEQGGELLTTTADDYGHVSVGDVFGDGGSAVTFTEYDSGTRRRVRPTRDADPAVDAVIDYMGCSVFGPSPDISGDSVPDVSVQSDGGFLSVFGALSAGQVLGTPDAVTFVDLNTSDPFRAQFNTTADINGDGLGDAAVVVAPYEDPSRYGGLVGVFLSPHPAVRERASSEWVDFLDAGVRTWNTRQLTPVMADVDGDGRPELLAAGSLEEEGAGTGLLVIPFDSSGNVDDTNVRLAWRDSSIFGLELLDDVDGDAQPDVLMTHGGPDGYWGTSIYPLPGPLVDYRDDLVNFSYEGVPMYYPRWPEVADGNNDGVQDILLRHDGYYDDEESQFFVLYLGGL